MRVGNLIVKNFDINIDNGLYLGIKNSYTKKIKTYVYQE